jgi:hypothetical protein
MKKDIKGWAIKLRGRNFYQNHDGVPFLFKTKRSEDNNVLFILNLEDGGCCTMHVKSPLLLDQSNLEKVLTAVRRGVHMLGLED